MSASRWLLGAAALAIFVHTGARASAQSCSASEKGVAAFVSAGRFEQTAASNASGWGFGAGIEFAPTDLLAARASYHQERFTGASLHVSGFGAVLRSLPVPGTPCLTLDALASVAGSLTKDGEYRNLTLPIGLVFTRPGTLTFFAGVDAILSVTQARLFSFTLREYTLGYGALAGARVHSGRFFTELRARASTLGPGIGPQPLGRFRADLGLGLRL